MIKTKIKTKIKKKIKNKKKPQYNYGFFGCKTTLNVEEKASNTNLSFLKKVIKGSPCLKK